MNIPQILLSVFAVSFISLIGVLFISLKKDLLKKITLFLVAISVGGLLGGAFLHLIPEAIEGFGNVKTVFLLILLGFLVFFVIEKFLRWRHCHLSTEKDHLKPFVIINLVGDGFHNFLDGVLIAASYSIDLKLGFVSTVAVILHEIPQEIGDFGVLVHGGLSVKKALLFNFLFALFAVFGAMLFIVFQTRVQEIAEYFIPISAGGFIYIAGSDLIPELQHNVKLSSSVYQFLFIIAGIMIMLLLVH